jgi:hypothetical protein
VPWPTTFLYAEDVIRAWLATQTGSLVGQGRPVPLGAHLKRLRSPYRGAYLLLSRVGGGPDPGEVNVDQARLSAAAYAMTARGAAAAAAAYANLLVSIAAPVPLSGGRLLAVTDLSGPLDLPDGDEERYVVDGLFHIQPN